MAELRNILIGIVLFSFVVISLTTFYNADDGLAANYGEPKIELSTKYDRIRGVASSQSIEAKTYNMSRSLSNYEASTTESESLRVGAFSALRRVWDSTVYIKDIIDQASTDLRLPNLFGIVVVIIVGLVITFAVVNAIFRTNM